MDVSRNQREVAVLSDSCLIAQVSVGSLYLALASCFGVTGEQV